MPSATHVNLQQIFLDEVEIRKIRILNSYLKILENHDEMSKSFKNNPKRSEASKFTQL